MSETLVDSNIILDINPLIYAEVSIRFTRIEEVDDAVPASTFRRDALPFQAGFLAGKVFVKYRRAGGERRSPLPDFCIGAHAAIPGMTLLTRDGSRYLTDFPSLELVSPSQPT